MRRIYCILTCLLFSTYVFPAESNAQDLPARKQEGTVFQASQFQNPDLKYAPMVRWWWPGNDVDNTELKRELELFASNHIGGVEIQPFALVVPMPEERAGANNR